ncbi:hypothetical protein DZC75_07835 [Pseudomonas parafulva]|uniref:PAAR repeat-containing protein n=1 Tax=Pseudomonas parafulva TaxID=157782 RepID=A0AAI8PB09_9PSED|nr:hypothetical protein [Pseudomonas parafulva]AXO87917.1 hypothetical protein DZC75_07835 [Pseudomonas parafulva]
MKPIVLIGHKHDCALHSEGEVVSGAIYHCGAWSFHFKGQEVARQGDHIERGGVLIEGDPNCQVS